MWQLGGKNACMLVLSESVWKVAMFSCTRQYTGGRVCLSYLPGSSAYCNLGQEAESLNFASIRCQI